MTINCRGRLVDLSTPRVMGILNITPDSFYDGSRHQSMDAVLTQAGRMLEEGADFLDIGGYSTRPGATDISVSEERDRVVPVIEALAATFPDALLSIDTFRAEVAQAAVAAGATMVNDVSAGQLDADMLKTVANLRVPYVMMHMRGTPQTMATLTDYDDIVGDILHYFSERIATARALGISDLILDPGFGFAKTIAQNFELLRRLEEFQVAGLPLLCGLSRKSTIYKTLGGTAEEALNGTTVLNTIALRNGAHILRVHDVKEAVEVVRLVEATRAGQEW
ncbi:MAG TPA: dihydropteroate synthase [Flavobacterium sp.]|nr:dihydropteroate synthase [Flavobacterium sp.]